MANSFSCDVFCPKCHVKMATLDSWEFDEFRKNGFDAGLCFDCNPFEADLYPEIFHEVNHDSLVVLSDITLAWQNNSWEKITEPHARAHDAHARTCLSSVTYLNGSYRNWAVLPNGRIVGPCPKCGNLGDLFASDGDLFCLCCKQVNSDEREIVLPLWLVGGVTSNA